MPFTPRLIPCILPNLAHHVPMIQTVALRTNKLLFDVVGSLPSPVEQTTTTTSASTTSTSLRNEKTSAPPPLTGRIPRSPTPSTAVPVPPTAPTLPNNLAGRAIPDNAAQPAPQQPSGSRPPSPVSTTSINGQQQPGEKLPQVAEDTDLFDYQATVNELTVQFLSEWEETRITTLKWLIMLHQKAPKKVSQPFLYKAPQRGPNVRS